MFSSFFLVAFLMFLVLTTPLGLELHLGFCEAETNFSILWHTFLFLYLFIAFLTYPKSMYWSFLPLTCQRTGIQTHGGARARFSPVCFSMVQLPLDSWGRSSLISRIWDISSILEAIVSNITDPFLSGYTLMGYLSGRRWFPSWFPCLHSCQFSTDGKTHSLITTNLNIF